MKNKAQELAVQYQSQTRKPPARKAAAVDMAVDEEEEEDANEEEEDEEEEEEEEEKLQTYQNAMYGNIRLDGVVAFIFDASGSMQGAKEKRVKRETIGTVVGIISIKWKLVVLVYIYKALTTF